MWIPNALKTHEQRCLTFVIELLQTLYYISLNFKTLKLKLKGHWTTSASSPDFFSKKLRFLYHKKCIPML